MKFTSVIISLLITFFSLAQEVDSTRIKLFEEQLDVFQSDLDGFIKSTRGAFYVDSVRVQAFQFERKLFQFKKDVDEYYDLDLEIYADSNGDVASTAVYYLFRNVQHIQEKQPPYYRTIKRLRTLMHRISRCKRMHRILKLNEKLFMESQNFNALL